MKKLKLFKIIAVISIFLFSFISHFVYDLFPNFFTSIFFPVNESIFEHMKIIYTSTLFYGFIEYLLLQYYKVPFHHFFLQLFISCFGGIILYLILYLPIRFLFGENLFVSIILLLIVYVVMQVVSYYLLQWCCSDEYDYLFIFPIGIILIIFAFFTYYPIPNMLFYDTSTQTYGIPLFTIK